MTPTAATPVTFALVMFRLVPIRGRPLSLVLPVLPRVGPGPLISTTVHPLPAPGGPPVERRPTGGAKELGGERGGGLGRLVVVVMVVLVRVCFPLGDWGPALEVVWSAL